MLKNIGEGFTLMEILLSLALIIGITAITIPVYGHFFGRNNLDNAVLQVVDDWRRAQILSRGVKNDASWGVYVSSSTAVVFMGSSYATRNPVYDEIKNLNSIVSVSGLSEVIFLKVSGNPSSSGTLILTSNNNESRNISINSQGTISY